MRCRWPKFSVKRLLALLLILTPLLAQSCADVTQVPLAVKEEPDRFIRIEPRAGDGDRFGTRRFSHPLTLSAEEWQRILSSIRIQKTLAESFLFTSDKNPVENAFTPDQIAFLGPGLSKALRRAHPDEFVVFGFSRPRSPQLTEITTGGWFVEGEQLHLVLANYRQAVSMSHIRDQLWNNPLQPNAGPSYDIVPGAYQSVGQATGIVRLVSAEMPDLAINYKALLAAKPTLQAPPPAATAPAVEDRPELSLEEKLITLKTLKERGLITEGEYQEKKKQLLDKF
jgi:hypothetical protein